MLKDPLLTDYELIGPSVQKIVKYFEDRLIELRLANDDPRADRLTRGRIAEIKTFNKALATMTPVKSSSHIDTMNH